MDVTIRFRATSDEKRILEAGAKRVGLSLSEWMRGVLLSASGDVAHVEGSPEPETVQEAVEKVVAAKKPTPAPLGKPMTTLTREEREAKIAEFQRKVGMGGGKKR